jgi:ATPase subunit of ABC transporter with duplicated ATPase domains
MTALLHDVHLTWPDGHPVFSGLSLQVPSGRTGLVGTNGSGKSTLLRLLAGDLTPQAGTVMVPGRVAWLRQDLALRADERVDEHLGIDAVRRALRALDAGHAAQRHLDTIGDRWDVEDRALGVLDRIGLPADVLDRRLGELSGGECVQLALAALLLDTPDVLLLDEPTNSLDKAARRHVHDLVAGYRRTLVVVSHDRDLLETVDQIGELRILPASAGRRTLTWYGGGWSSYTAAVRAEQEAAEQAVTAARSDERRQKQDLAAAAVVLARRKRYGRKMWDSKREPKAVMRLRKRSAQESAGKYRAVHQDRLADARERRAEAELRLRDGQEIRIALPGTEVPRGLGVLVLDDVVLRNGVRVELELRGPERVAVTGRNGSGKTTLVHTVCGLLSPESGRVEAKVPVRLLPQRLDVLDPRMTVAENAAAFAPGAGANAIRARLARLLFQGDAADREVSALSGGELFRATLACLLLAEPAPRLLVLDEPTNNLDLASYGALVSALESYRGALLVASHDSRFLEDIGVTRALEL